MKHLERGTIMKNENEIARGMSRRSFLTGAAVAGLGAGAAGILSGCSPAASSTTEASDAATSEKAAASSDYPWPDTPPTISEDQIEEELETDVLVIGMGVSGVSAFRSACEEGVSVIAVEKADSPQCRSDNYSYINGSMTEDLGLGTVDLDEVIKEEWEASGEYASYRIIRKFMTNEADVFDWWAAGDSEMYFPKKGETDEINRQYLAGELEHPYTMSCMIYPDADFSDPKAYWPVRAYVTDHPHLLAENVQRGIEAGGQVFYGHFAEQLIVSEDGSVNGAYVRNSSSGQYKKISSHNGVILATGGCESDEGIMKKFYPHTVEVGNLSPWPNFDIEGNLTNTGDGYRMGYWAGAKFSPFMAPMAHVMGGSGDTSDMASSGGMTSPHLHLNYDGKRFMNEEIDCTSVEVALEGQPQGKCFLFCDSHLDEQTPQCYEPIKGRVLGKKPWTLAELDELVDGETVFRADTIEELIASIPGMNAEVALASIERYNNLCNEGHDEDFGKSKKYLWPVQDGPFYAQRVGLGLLLTTMGGLYSDEEARVYNNDLDIIPGLYAVGNIQGNRYAVKYPWRVSGCSHAMAMYYGYIAGKNSAKTPLA